MPLNPQQHLDATLRRLARVKHQERKPSQQLGPEMGACFKDSVQKRQTKLAKRGDCWPAAVALSVDPVPKRQPKLAGVAECWARLVPPPLNAHCSLESLSRGTLIVLVDTSSHLYDLKQLLLAGLQQQILLACASAGLKK